MDGLQWLLPLLEMKMLVYLVSERPLTYFIVTNKKTQKRLRNKLITQTYLPPTTYFFMKKCLSIFLSMANRKYLVFIFSRKPTNKQQFF